MLKIVQHKPQKPVLLGSFCVPFVRSPCTCLGSLWYFGFHATAPTGGRRECEVFCVSVLGLWCTGNQRPLSGVLKVLICADRAKPASVKRRVRERQKPKCCCYSLTVWTHTENCCLDAPPDCWSFANRHRPTVSDVWSTFLGQCWSEYHITVISGPRKLFQMLYWKITFW